jgi:hypothetical protein
MGRLDWALPVLKYEKRFFFLEKLVVGFSERIFPVEKIQKDILSEDFFPKIEKSYI